MHIPKSTFLLFYACLPSSERCWWGYNGLKPSQQQTESSWCPQRFHAMSPLLSCLSDPISYHSPLIYYSWTFFIAPQILWPWGPFHQPFTVFQNLHIAGAFSWFGFQSKGNLSESLLWQPHLRSRPYPYTSLPILLPWLILFTAFLIIWTSWCSS